MKQATAAVPNDLPAGAGIEAMPRGEGERFGGDGDMDAAQQLVDELDLLAVAGVRSDDRRGARLAHKTRISDQTTATFRK